MCGVVLIVGSALCSRAARCFRAHSQLVELVGRAAGLLVGLLLLSTLKTGIIMFIERVTLLLTSLWGMGTLVVV